MGSTMEKIKGRFKEAVGEVQDKAERAVEKTRDA